MYKKHTNISKYFKYNKIIKSEDFYFQPRCHDKDHIYPFAGRNQRIGKHGKKWLTWHKGSGNKNPQS